MTGAVHNGLAGPGQLGEDRAVVAALVYGEHGVRLRPAADDVRGLDVGQRQSLHIRLAALAGAQAEHLDIPGRFFLHQSLHYIYDYQIVGSDGKKEALTGDSYAAAVQAALDKEFGAGKIKVTNESTATDYDGSKLANSMQLKFQSQANSDLVVNTDVGKAMGIGNIATNYLSTSKTLGELMEEGAWDGLTPAKGVGGPIEKNGKLVDLKGNLVNKDGNLVDKDGNELYAFKINGATIGNYGKGTTLSTIT